MKRIYILLVATILLSAFSFFTGGLGRVGNVTATPISTWQGGLGTTTAPTISQFPVGSSGGFYNPTSSSTVLSLLGLSSAVTGSGTSGQVSYFTGTNTVSSSANFTFDGNNTSVAGTSTAGTFKLSALSAAMQIYANSDTNTGIHFPGPDIMEIDNAGNTTAYFTSLNRVGINTSSPAYVLDVNGTFHASGTSTLPWLNLPNQPNAYLGTDSAGHVVATSTPQNAHFTIENPTNAEDDVIMTFDATSTLKKIYTVNKTSGDTLAWNLCSDTNRSVATSSCSYLALSNYGITTATSTASSTTNFSTSTIPAGGVTRLVTVGTASSTQFNITVYWTTP